MVAPHRDGSKSEFSRLWRGVAATLACIGRIPYARLDPTDADAFERAAPKVALSVLSMGASPQEKTWHRWFDAARDQVPLAPLQQVGCGLRAVSEAVAPKVTGLPATNPIAGQQLFSVYVHVPSGVSYSDTSIFAPYVIDTRLETRWGEHSITQAMRATLAEGLKNEANQVFITTSDDAVPLHPPTVFYQATLNFPVSRINACLGTERTLSRWHDTMSRAPTPVTRDDWRKSSQWFQLKRAHAALLLHDEGIDATFRDYCMWDLEHPPCASDEHYPATALSMLGQAPETDCQGDLMLTDWRNGGAHPYTFEDDDIVHGLLDGMAAQEDCDPFLAQQMAGLGFATFGTDLTVAQGACRSMPAWPVAILGSQCPLLGRKFGASADARVEWWMGQVLKQTAALASQGRMPGTRAVAEAKVAALLSRTRAEHFPEAGCASTKRDYVWPAGVFMDFACPTGVLGDADMIEALRCYTERPVCDAVIAAKRRFLSVDSGFADTLEGQGAINEGIRVLHTLRASAKPSRHKNVAPEVIRAVRDSILSVPFYLDEWEVVESDRQVELLSALWFECDGTPDMPDERYVDYSVMLGRMLRNPMALEAILRRLFDKSLPWLTLPRSSAFEFESAVTLAEAVARALANVRQGSLSVAPGARPPSRGLAGYRLGEAVTTLGERLRFAELAYPRMDWLTTRDDGFAMLAGVMVVQSQGRDTQESAERIEALEMASEAMQPDKVHMRIATDLRALTALARTLARPGIPPQG